MVDPDSIIGCGAGIKRGVKMLEMFGPYVLKR